MLCCYKCCGYLNGPVMQRFLVGEIFGMDGYFLHSHGWAFFPPIFDLLPFSPQCCGRWRNIWPIWLNKFVGKISLTRICPTNETLSLPGGFSCSFFGFFPSIAIWMITLDHLGWSSNEPNFKIPRQRNNCSSNTISNFLLNFNGNSG